jgi:diadenylate cyclase
MPLSLFQSVVSQLPRPNVTAALDILLVAYLIYQLTLVVKGTRAAHILVGLGLLVALYYGSLLGGLETLHSILSHLVPYSVLAIIILFQSEIRRTLGRLGRRRLLRGSSISQEEPYDDVVLALTHLAQAKIGALIVVEQETGLRTFVESGVALDARLSYDLLMAIFHPGGPLHDGAVIVQQDKIAAAACFLPLTTNPALASQLGTRHRAALGVTEESDAIAFVVSEETGRISVASAGTIEFGVDAKQLRSYFQTPDAARSLAAPASPESGAAALLPTESREASH